MYSNSRKLIFLIQRTLKGDGRQVLWDIFCKIRGIDLGHIPLEALGIPEETGNWHENSGGPNLTAVIKSLPVTADDAVIDLGCGKGGALITFSRFPFRAIHGVDVSEKLLSIAARNLEKLKRTNVTLSHSNAADFVDLDDYTVVYMFNPFLENVMKKVISNINHSTKNRPRDVTIIYKNPVCHDVIVNNSNFRVIRKYDRFLVPVWIYKNTE